MVWHCFGWHGNSSPFSLPFQFFSSRPPHSAQCVCVCCLLFRHNRHLIAFINWYEVLNHRHDSPVLLSLLRFASVSICYCVRMNGLIALWRCFSFYMMMMAMMMCHTLNHGIMAKLENNQMKFIHSFHLFRTIAIFETDLSFFSFLSSKKFIYMVKAEMHCRTFSM